MFAPTQGSGRVCLYDRRQLVEGELFEVNLLAGVIDVDADQITFGVVIKDNPLCDLSNERKCTGRLFSVPTALDEGAPLKVY